MRALAIIPVLLFHSGLTWLGGGFVGVDIFFVVSGYLITAIIAAELESGGFSLLDFWRRRLLRIVPLLLVVLLVALLAGQLLLFPNELQALGQSAVWAALFASNMHFFWTADYFAASARSMPLLHTWSLAVEEQFYFGFPLLVWALHRRARALLVPLLVALVLGSLALSVWGTLQARFFAFYLLPARAWELGAGALLALRPLPLLRGWPRETLAWLGLGLLLAPMLYLSETSAFPGLNALPPVLGAVLVIAYGERTKLGRALKWPQVVYLGLLSYGLYLWHWPVIVFDTILTGPDRDELDLLRVLALTLALAALSRHLVELPFRRGLLHGAPLRVLASGVAALLLVAGIGVAAMRSETGMRHFPPQALVLADYARYPDTQEYRTHFQAGHCFLDDRDPPGTSLDRSACLRLDPHRPNILLLGDSHAAHLSGGLRAAYPQYNFLQATAAGCRPIAGVWQDRRCAQMVGFLQDDFLPQTELDGVIIAGRWRRGDAAGLAALARTLHRLGPEVMVVGPSVEYAAAVPALLARAQLGHAAPGLLSRAMLPEPAEVDRLLAVELTRPGITYRSVLGIVCPDRHCRETAPDGVPMQFDYGHLTLAGAKVVASGLLEGWLEK